MVAIQPTRFQLKVVQFLTTMSYKTRLNTMFLSYDPGQKICVPWSSHTLDEYWSGTPQLVQRLRYWLDDREMLRFPTGEREFSFLQSVQTNPGNNPGRGSHFPGLKWQRLEADHLLPSSAEVKYVWHFTSIFAHAFKVCEGTSFFTCIHIINKKVAEIFK
jgi:hypothetical protein